MSSIWKHIRAFFVAWYNKGRTPLTDEEKADLDIHNW